MPLIPLAIQPGIYSNGTDFQGSNRWIDANLIRWQNGSLRPIGGWSTKTTGTITGAPRSMIAWIDNGSDPHLVTGTYNGLFHIDGQNAIADITPTSLTAGYESGTENAGYGNNLYGKEPYGTQRSYDGYISDGATTWDLDTWGEYLVACSNVDGKLYEWQLDATTPTVAAAISGAPINCLGLVVTEERFLVALGASGNPRLLKWCDREDNTTWTAAATNEAGDIELQTNGRIMDAVRVKGQTLIVTNVDAHTMTYQGPPYVHSIERVGTTCGVASRNGIVSVNDHAFWFGNNAFFVFNGNSVSEIPCEVTDKVFRNINSMQISKVYAVHNSQFGEIWWFYPSEESLENDKYVVYDYNEGHWNTGSLERTAGVDRNVFDFPVWATSDGATYEHEKVNTAHGAETPYAETGPISLGNGDNVMRVTRLIPDELTQGDVTATFDTRFHPNDTERTYGPYIMNNPTSVRFTGRQIRMKVESANNEDFRVGTMRIEGTPGGIR